MIFYLKGQSQPWANRHFSSIVKLVNLIIGEATEQAGSERDIVPWNIQ
jgi:hypothetical protein